MRRFEKGIGLDNQQPSPQGKVQRLGQNLTHECQSKYLSISMSISIQPYLDAICAIRTKTKNADVSNQTIQIKLQTHKYSNTHTPVPRFLLDNTEISRNNDLVVGYRCLNCGVQNEITLNLYLRKVANQSRCCDACKNMDPAKRLEHSAWMSGPKIPVVESKWKDKPLEQRLEESEQAFLAEDTDFQASYFLNHLTKDEFQRIRTKLTSVGQGKITDLSMWEYFPYYRIWNQTKYAPMLIHTNKHQIETPAYVRWVCEECDQAFVNRDLEVQKNRLRILCAECGTSSRTCKIRSIITLWGKIRYQSVQEKRVIEWCVENNIRIENGPRISYSFDGKDHNYKVDFQLPLLQTIVEIKDNHVWHKQHVASGKWSKKEEAAQAWCAEHRWQYDMVFPKTLAKWKEEILVRYSLTLQETVRSKDKEPCDNIGGNL